MKNALSLFFLLIITCINIGQGQPPHLQRALEQEAAFRRAVSQETYHLQNLLKDIDDTGSLKQQCLQRLQQDLVWAQRLEKELEGFTPNDILKNDGDITWSLKTNKLTLIIPLTHQLIENEFSAVMDGSLTNQYMQELSSIADSPPKKKGQMHGASGATILKNALFIILHHTKNFEPNVDESALFHTSPLIPLAGIEACSYYYKDDKSPAQGELLFPHSGYALGGMRGEQRHHNKIFGPQDCSSWVRHLCDIPVEFSTMHLFYLWENTEDEWLKSEAARTLKNRLKPVSVKNISDIQPGYLYVHRAFNLTKDPSMSLTPGNSGHTGIVHHIDSEGKIIVLQYGRDMPTTEGFSLWEAKPFPNRKIFYFEVLPPSSL